MAEVEASQCYIRWRYQKSKLESTVPPADILARIDRVSYLNCDMENQIDDPVFKMIVLAAIGCGIMFIVNEPPASSLGKDARHHRVHPSSLKGNSPLTTTAKYQPKFHN